MNFNYDHPAWKDNYKPKYYFRVFCDGCLEPKNDDEAQSLGRCYRGCNLIESMSQEKIDAKMKDNERFFDAWLKENDLKEWQNQQKLNNQ